MTTEKKPNMLIGLDSIQRKLFTTPGGSEVLKYLKSLTIDAVAGPEISNESLRHLEGQRYLVGLIQRRVNKGISQNTVQETQNG